MYMRLLVAEHGASPDCLGCCVPYSHTTDEILAQSPDLVVVSTVNGHGSQQGGELMRIIVDRLGRKAPPCVVGGQLSVESSRYHRAAESLLRAGYKRVFYGESAIPAFNRFMRELIRCYEPGPSALTG